MTETERRLTTTSPASARVSDQTRQEFAEFYSAEFRSVLASVFTLGATREEANDAVCAAMVDVLKAWDRIDHPAAYARTAATRYFVKERQRDRNLRRRLIEGGEVTPAADMDGPSIWEDQQWVVQVLGSLPPAQRQVMALIIDEFGPAEIAQLLGKTPETVRQTLYAARRRLREEPSTSRTSAEPPKQGPVSSGKKGRRE